MYKLLIFCFGLLLFQGDKTEFSWNENVKLAWKDFQGKPNLNSDAVAVTASGITFSYSIKKTETKVLSFKTIIKADFYPEHSWCKKREVDNHVLGHEQLHFDITELHARLFKQKVATLKTSNTVAEQLQRYHKEIDKALEKMQSEYDNESNYSINKEGQALWQNYVEKELKKLHKYKS
jgi:hypothetical protein